VADHLNRVTKPSKHYSTADCCRQWFYCPSMPRQLVNATKEYRDGRISWDTWAKRIEQRRVYKMKRHEAAPRADCAVLMQCPARGSGATVECPLARGCGSKKKEYSAKLEVTPPPEKKRGKVCTNKDTVTFPEEAGAKLLQDYHFGSKEWQAQYSCDRNTIEVYQRPSQVRRYFAQRRRQAAAARLHRPVPLSHCAGDEGEPPPCRPMGQGAYRTRKRRGA
jgi:hypothetical protein